MNKGGPIPVAEMEARKNNLVTTVMGDGLFDETDYDYFARSPGKMKPKPDDTHRAKLSRRAAEQIAMVNKITPDRLLKTPSEKHTENMRKKLRRRDAKQDAMKSHD